MLVLDVREIKAARLNQAGRTENRPRFIVTIITVEDSELAVTQADAAHTKYQLVALERLLVMADQAQRYYFLGSALRCRLG